MTTKIYGHGDALTFEGDVSGKVDRSDAIGTLVIVVCSDGTVLVVTGLWPWVSTGITPLSRGSLFDRIELDTDEGAIAHFRNGLKWACVGMRWTRISGEPTCST